MRNREEIVAWWDSELERTLSQFGTFLGFQSISADPAYNDQCEQCVEWLAEHVRTLGFAPELRGTPGKRSLFAVREGEVGAPTVLVYSHYDVQPPGELSEWTTPPFEAHVREGRVFARGAVDNKGQCLFILKALEALIQSGELRCTVKLLIEGEEETGSGELTKSLEQWRSDLKADVVLVCDTGMPSGRPTIMIGLRGIAGITMELRGPSRELHSGYHGNLVPNPARELAKIIAAMFNPDGSIAIPGYYDGIEPVDASLKNLINAAPFDAVAYERETGCAPNYGETQYPLAERVGLRPSIDIHGFHSGYDGPGVKTIVPPSARVVLSTRVVVGQDPGRCVDLIEAFTRERVPKGMRLEMIHKDRGGRAMLTNPSSPTIQLGARILREVFNIEPVYRCHGASIPILSDLVNVSGGEPLISGFSLESDRLHAVNESFGLDRMRAGFLYCVTLLRELSGR